MKKGRKGKPLGRILEISKALPSELKCSNSVIAAVRPSKQMIKLHVSPVIVLRTHLQVTARQSHLS